MIITQEHLFTYHLKNIMAGIYMDWVAAGQNESFDQYCFDHFQDLGEGLYNEIGASFGDCDDLIEEIY